MPGRTEPSSAETRGRACPHARTATRPPEHGQPPVPAPPEGSERRGPARFQSRLPPHTARARPRTVLQPPSERTLRAGGRWAALPSLMPSPRGEAHRGPPPGPAYRRGRTAPAGARPHRPRRRPRRGRGHGGGFPPGAGPARACAPAPWRLLR